MNCYFHLKRNTLKYPTHFCLDCYWIAFNSVQKTPFLRWTVMMVEAGPWGCLFWREMTVASKLNIPLSFPFSGVYWRCLWPRWLGQLDSLDTEGVHPDCWVRAFCLATASPSPPPPPSPLPYPPWVYKKDDLWKRFKEPSLLTGFLCKPNYMHKGWEGGERKRYMGGWNAKFARAWDCRGQINIALKSWVRH